MRIIPPADSMRRWVLFATGASASFLAFALISQYGFELHPCELCIKQRIPYAVIVMLGALSIWPKVPERLAALVLGLCVILFFMDAGIAFYHAGVEAGWFPGPSGCTTSAKGEQTLEEMRAEIMNAELVPCDQPMARVLGLSMAAWNAVAAVGSAVVCIWGFCRVRKINRAKGVNI